MLVCKNELTNAKIENIELKQQLTCIQAELEVVSESQAKHQDNLLLAQREFKQQSKTVKKQYKTELAELRIKLGEQIQLVREQAKTVNELRAGKNYSLEHPEKPTPDTKDNSPGNSTDVLYF